MTDTPATTGSAPQEATTEGAAARLYWKEWSYGMRNLDASDKAMVEDCFLAGYRRGLAAGVERERGEQRRVANSMLAVEPAIREREQVIDDLRARLAEAEQAATVKQDMLNSMYGNATAASRDRDAALRRVEALENFIAEFNADISSDKYPLGFIGPDETTRKPGVCNFCGFDMSVWGLLRWFQEEAFSLEIPVIEERAALADEGEKKA